MAAVGPNRKGDRQGREGMEREPAREEPYEHGENPEEGSNPDEQSPGGERLAEDGGQGQDEGSEPLPDREGEDIYGEQDYPPDEEAYPEDEAPELGRGHRGPGLRDDTRSAHSRALALRDSDEDEESEESTRAGSQVRLEVLEGPDAGRVKRFRRVRMVIGRSSSCDFRLADGSVSRRHVELVRGEKGVLLRDLGSGNGTQVNGEQATERFLEHEDTIALGHTRIRFHDEQAALRKLQAEVEAARSLRPVREEPPPQDPEPADLPDEPSQAGQEEVVEASIVPATPIGRAEKRLGLSRLSSMQKRAVLAGLVLGAVLVGSLFFLAHPNRPVPPDPRQVAAAKRMEEARAAFADGRYEEALQKIDTAERLVAGADKEKLKDRVMMESAGRDAIRVAEAALEAGDFAAVRAALKKVPDASVHRGRRDALAREATTREAEAVYRQVAAAFDTQNAEAAERALREVTPEVRAVLGKRLTAFEERLGSLRVEAERRAEEQRAAKEQELQRAQEAELRTAFASVSRRFQAGEYDRAVLEVDRVVERYPDNPRIRERGEELRRLIPAFARSLEEGQLKIQAGAPGNAVRPLRKARELYQQLDLPGALGARLDQDLTSALVAAGNAALARKDWAAAAESFREALALSPGEPDAVEGLARLGREAEQAYLEGLRLWDKEPAAARAKLRVAAEIAEPGSATYHKARQQLGLQ